MKKKYLHISFNSEHEGTLEELEPIFESMSDDWIRYSGNCWIVWTSYSPKEWFDVLEPILEVNNLIVILEVPKNKNINPIST